jgi:HEXXH motif-containing protein
LGQRPEASPAAAEAGRSTEWQAQVRQAIDVLLGSGALTPLGEQFVGQMRHSAAR